MRACQGQLLARPVVTPPLRVRCPQCATILEAPPGVSVFACRCGLHLSPPTQTLNAAAGAGGNAGQLSNLPSARDLGKSQMQPASINSSWKRRIVDTDKLGWRKTWSEAEEAMVMDAESVVLEQLEVEELRKRTSGELVDKLRKLGHTADPQSAHEVLVQRVLATRQAMGQRPERELRQLLDTMGIDHKLCGDSNDLATRLFSFVWSDGETAAMVNKDGWVRHFKPATGNESASLEWLPAYEFHILMRPTKAPDGTLNQLSATNVYQISQQPFRAKCEWMRFQLNAMRTKWEEGHVKLRIRRSNLLEDSFNNFLKLKPEDMRRYFRFEFINEPGVDAGGVAREWFNLVSDLCFNVDFGLFEYGGTDNVCYQISPMSGMANDLHLQYFRFLGRLMGKALFDGHQIGPHLTRAFYKHLLAWPITEDDVEFVDSQIASSMKEVRQCEDVSVLCLDFTTAVSAFGETQEIELKPGGKDIEVTNENRDEYLSLLLKHIMMGRVAKQLGEFLIGVYEVVPLAVLSVFDYSELELLLCGLPEIDVDDWMTHTKYKGEYEAQGVNHPTIKTFWELMRASSVEQRARFLQFSTGTSRVPVQGFGALQGNDGNIKIFTIDSVKLTDSVFPRAHTCFNRVDLPPYQTKAEMVFRIGQALQMEGTGFAID